MGERGQDESKLSDLHKVIVATIACVGRKEVVAFLRAEADDIESWMKSCKVRVVPGFF